MHRRRGENASDRDKLLSAETKLTDLSDACRVRATNNAPDEKKRKQHFSRHSYESEKTRISILGAAASLSPCVCCPLVRENLHFAKRTRPVEHEYARDRLVDASSASWSLVYEPRWTAGMVTEQEAVCVRVEPRCLFTRAASTGEQLRRPSR